MAAAVIVFFVVTGLILGGYLALSSLPGMMKQRQLDRRLREIAAPIEQPMNADSLVLKANPNAFLDRMAASTRGGARLSHLVEQSGVRMTPGKVIFISLGAAVICGLLAAVLVRQNWVAPVAAAAGLVAPTVFLMRKRSVRLRKFEEQFPEALDLLSRAVKAGHAFQTAMNMVADELPEPVGPEFRKTFDQQNFGLPLRDALNAMAERIPMIDVKFFVTAVLIQRETGGNLSEILDNLSQVVRERFKVLRQVRVHTAHGRFTGWVLLALPAALAMAMSFMNPEHMDLLFRESIGRTMLVGAAVMQVIGYFWIQHVIKIEV